MIETKKIYYEDAYNRSFSTKVVEQKKEESSGRSYVLLEETAFYPTGGGQPCDLGTIGEFEVEQVEEVDGEIRHYITSPIKVDESQSDFPHQSIVDCEINWERRFDHMQQHMGQHILSAAFVKLFDVDTVSFHLGEEVCTIDLKTSNISEDDLKKGEELANKIILENRPVETIWVTKKELLTYPMRKQPKLEEDIRLVIIPDYDYNGCGGTHPKSTGEVIAIKTLGVEKMRGNVRLQFVCGTRVRKELGSKHQVLQQLTDILSAPELDLHEAVERLLKKEKELKNSNEEKTAQLMHYEAKELMEEAQSRHIQSMNYLIIDKIYQDRPVNDLQKLAQLIIQDNKSVIVLLVNRMDDGIQFLCARGKGTDLNLKELAPTILSFIDGRGGGRDSQIQGGGKGMSADEFVKNTLQFIQGK